MRGHAWTNEVEEALFEAVGGVRGHAWTDEVEEVLFEAAGALVTYDRASATQEGTFLT